jgi:hypothetical protein
MDVWSAVDEVAIIHSFKITYNLLKICYFI